MSLDLIEKQAKVYAASRQNMVDIATTMNDEIEAIKKKHLSKLKRAVTNAADEHDVLKRAIEDHKNLFTKPRTVTLHGIKLGFQKGKGSIVFTDAGAVVKLVRKHLADRADVLIETKETPVKSALAQLSVAELKKIGCTVVDASDSVVIKAADSEVDKLVDALLIGATKEVE